MTVAAIFSFAWATLIAAPPLADAQDSKPAPRVVDLPEAGKLPEAGTRLDATDTLDCQADPLADAELCLAGLRWVPGPFAVDVRPAVDGRGDSLLCFPSPHPAGDAAHDRVSMEWYAARDDSGQPIRAPAVVVVHESGRSMPVGRMIARGLQSHGLHAMMIHLPGYGQRRSPLSDKPEMILASLRQGIADVRRARDAVAALPLVDTSRIGVQGTSLGGFVTSTVVGLDAGFDRGFILLAGGRLDQVVLQGKKDAAKIRQQLASLGIDDAQIVELARPIEPLRLAHRIRPQQTWLYNGMFDDVVPRASSYALAQAAKLPEGHHIELMADHYTGIIFLPVVLQQIKDAMTE